MAKIGAYLKDTFDELLYKVSWPTWQELQNSTIIVMVSSLIIGIIIFLMDKSFNTILSTYYHLFD